MSTVTPEKVTMETITKTTTTKSYTSPNSLDKSLSSLDSKSPSAISDSSVRSSKSSKSEKSPKSEKSTKSEKAKTSLISVSEALRKDAKFPSGKETKSDDERGSDKNHTKTHSRWLCLLQKAFSNLVNRVF